MPVTAWIGALLIGVTMGLLGSGGSILTVPALVYLVDQPEKVAIAGSLLIVGTIALLGSVLAALRKTVAILGARLAAGADTSALCDLSRGNWRVHAVAERTHFRVSARR